MKTAEEVLSQIAGDCPDYINFDLCIKAMKWYAHQNEHNEIEIDKIINSFDKHEIEGFDHHPIFALDFDKVKKAMIIYSDIKIKNTDTIL